MFSKAVEIAAGFTRPICTISRNYGSQAIQAAAATLFFVNSDGWALTCCHVADLIPIRDQLFNKHQSFLTELATLRGQKRETHFVHELEKKYSYSKETTVELLLNFINCFDGEVTVEIKRHPSIDVALLHFRDFKKLGCNSFPKFAGNGADLKQGKYLCRLGFPFAEFTNFAYDKTIDSIHWTDTGKPNTPQFPIEGMVTRHVQDENGIIGFELSTPGLLGQSGGPAFDTEGVIWGMQSQTVHLDLNFDVDQEVIRAGKKQRIKDSAFLHVGRCIHIDILKSFMRENGVEFQEV